MASNFIIEENVTVRPGVSIGAGTTVKVGAILGTGTQIGEDCFIGPGAMTLHMTPEKNSVPPIIRDRVFIGGGAIVCPGTVLNNDVIIGAGSVVLAGIYSKGTYVGNPARKVK